MAWAEDGRSYRTGLNDAALNDGNSPIGERVICDYSLQMVKSRPAVVGEKLISHNFGYGTHGFASVDDVEACKMTGEACNTAVCVLPGTELSFQDPIGVRATWDAPERIFEEKVARFRQLNKDNQRTHHDVLELPDGTQIYLHNLGTGQIATVLQLPAAPKNEAEAEEQRRVEVVG